MQTNGLKVGDLVNSDYGIVRIARFRAGDHFADMAEAGFLVDGQMAWASIFNLDPVSMGQAVCLTAYTRSPMPARIAAVETAEARMRKRCASLMESLGRELEALRRPGEAGMAYGAAAGIMSLELEGV
jgi:hypothetical protein